MALGQLRIEFYRSDEFQSDVYRQESQYPAITMLVGDTPTDRNNLPTLPNYNATDFGRLFINAISKSSIFIALGPNPDATSLVRRLVIPDQDNHFIFSPGDKISAILADTPFYDLSYTIDETNDATLFFFALML